LLREVTDVIMAEIGGLLAEIRGEEPPRAEDLTENPAAEAETDPKNSSVNTVENKNSSESSEGE
jgi:hypothetical protein